jgi:pyridoxine kinase
VQRNKLLFDAKVWQGRIMDIVSVQSRVTWGYVGNAVAVPVLQALGTNAWPVDTVRLSFHPGHGVPWRRLAEPDEVQELLTDSIEKAGPSLGFLMGYLGNAEQGQTLIDMLMRQRDAEHNSPFYLDPAFGDDPGGAYVDPSIIEFYSQQAIQHADVVMLNRYELATLSGQGIASVDDAIQAGLMLIATGCKSVMASSIPASDTILANVYVDAGKAFVCETKHIPLKSKGTGDLLSAAFCGYHSAGHAPDQSLASASAIVQRACIHASENKLSELNMIALLRDIHAGIAPLPVEQKT